jgi:alpha-L-fucosidase
MARDISYEEARQEKLDDLTFIHYTKLRHKLQGGNADLVATIDEAISHKLDQKFWSEAVIAAAGVHGNLVIGNRIVKLVEEALQAQAEVLARKEVEQLEKQRKESQDEAQIDLAVMDRAMAMQI